MSSIIRTRSYRIMLVTLAVFSFACAPGSSVDTDLDGSLANDGIEFREAWISMPDGVRLAADL